MKIHNMAEDGTKLLKMNSAGPAAAEDVHLMMMPTANDEIENAASAIFGNSFVRLISCFALERPSASSKFRRRRFYGCLQAMKRPFGRTHLLVHLFTVCLAIRALYCLISIALAPSLGIVWLQSTLLLGSVGCSFVLIGALMQIATFDRHLEYRPLDRFAWLRAAAYSNPKNAPSSIAPNTAFCTLLIAFCFYLWAISSSTEIFFQTGYYNLLANLFNNGGKMVIPMPDIDGGIAPTMATLSTISDNLTLSPNNSEILSANNDSIGDNAQQGQQSAANGDAGPTANLNLFGGGGIFLVSTVTAFENAWLCGLAISVHFFVANAVFLAYSEFMRELSEKIVTRKIAKNEELDAIMRRSDNLLRFAFFARMQFTQLGWAAFGVGAMVNLSAVLLFCQFDADKMRNLLLFANAPVNNLLTTFLLFATAAFLGIFFNSLIMDFRFEDLRRLLSLENSFPNPIDPNTQRLAQALLERLELANSFQMGLHRLQLLFTGQFPLIFAIIGIFNQNILQIIIFISTISTVIFLLGLAFKVAKWMRSSKDQNARMAMMKNI